MPLNPTNQEKPWGGFRQFTLNEPSTVKLLTVLPGQSISLQQHSKREEFWRVLEGNPTIVIGERSISAKPGDEFTIEPVTSHRITATTDKTVILEISLGEFDENDIVRLDDQYGRV